MVQQSTLQLAELRFTKAPSLCCTQWTQASSLVCEPLCWSACCWWGHPGTRSPLWYLHFVPGYMDEAFFTFRRWSSTIVLSYSSSSSRCYDAVYWRSEAFDMVQRSDKREPWKGRLGKLEFYERILWIGTHFILSCKQTKPSITVSLH